MRSARRCPVVHFATIALACLAGSGAAAAKTRPFTTTVPDKPAARDRHTLFLANFDGAASNEADYARHEPRAQTLNTMTDVPGRFGKGVAFSEPPYHRYRDRVSFIIYDGESNWLPERGSLSFWIRSAKGKNIWKDDKTYSMIWLRVRPDSFYAKHLGESIVVKKTGKGKESRIGLMAKKRSRREPARPRFGVSCAHLDPGEWHHVFVSWDLSEGGAYWLAVDGKGLRCNEDPPLKKGWAKPGFKIYAGVPHAKGDALDFTLDDLVITEQSVRSAAQSAKRRLKGWQKIDPAKLMAAEDAARRWLDLLAGLQWKGTWHFSYAWPTLRKWNSRHCYLWGLGPRDKIAMGKGFGSLDTTRQFMRAYRILGDRRYLEVCRRAGDFAIKVQKRMGGGWPTYPVEIQPDGSCTIPYASDLMNIQEGTQLGAAMLMARLWHETGEKRYLDAFRWSCDTMLQAQNPCGSWSGGYHLKTKRVGGHGYSWLNDGATGCGFTQMVAAYHVLKEKKYWDAAIRSADWVVRVQVRTPIGWGWAQQYNEKDEPCWGRTYGHASEPPAVCTWESRGVCTMLALAYDMTGDPKYLDAIRKYADFVDHSECAGSYYCDIKTGRPIVPWNRKVYFKEDVLKAPPALAQLLKKGFGYRDIMAAKPPDSSRLRGKWLLPRKTGPYTYPLDVAVRGGVEFGINSLKSKKLGEYLAKQHASGAWISASPTGEMFSAMPTQSRTILTTIYHARVGLGEIPSSRVRRWWRYWPDIDPSIDYQDTPALKAKGWTREQKGEQPIPPLWILKGAMGWF